MIMLTSLLSKADNLKENLDFGKFNYLDLGLAVLLLACFCMFIGKAVKKSTFIIVAVIYLVLKVPCVHFDFRVAGTIIDIATLSVVIGYCILFQSEFYKLYTRNRNIKSKKSRTIGEVNLYDELVEAVLNLSETNTGAIITIEKNDNLDFYINKSVLIECPVRKEVLATIFYNGTRLHDGAVIIRGNQIIAASVYYTPTARGLTGAYGARHRAALGISEHTDSLTIVVSEETGRISFAERGELISVTRERFPQELSNRL